jgi:hypothetical protein
VRHEAMPPLHITSIRLDLARCRTKRQAAKGSLGGSDSGASEHLLGTSRIATLSSTVMRPESRAGAVTQARHEQAQAWTSAMGVANMRSRI